MRNRETVLSEIRVAVEQERQSTLRVLHLLREVERDRHFLEMGYPSLFEFATRELGYSPAAAQRRIASMRLLKVVPELESKLEDGTLSLCVAAKTQSFFRQEDQRRKEAGIQRMAAEAKREIAESMIGLSNRDCERKLVELSPAVALPKEKTRPVADGKTLVQFVADDGLIAKLEKLKGLLAHQNFDGKYEKLIELLADMVLKKLEPKDSDDAPLLPTLEVKSRYIPKAVKNRVWKRDDGKCTYMDPESGRRCESMHGIQLDHIQPYSKGGKNSVENLRLRCGAHNRFTAELEGLGRYGLDRT